MASEKDDKKKTAKPAAKPAAEKAAPKAAAKPAEAAAEKPAAAAEKPAAKAAAKPAKKAAAAATSGPPCRVEGCKQAVRAKGYCRKHYISWRRGDVGDHHRYKICTKEGCRKPRTKGSLCDEHAGTGAPAAAAPAAEGGAPA
ncbi:MAG TPA: hypothetical protein VKQ32_29415 [Polyangia bacterium]|nr:hypothetical protein [Polyangia bacterium]